MALPRVYTSFSRSFLSRGSLRVASASTSTRFTVPHRQFASSSWRLQNTTQEPSVDIMGSAPPKEIPEALRAKNSRSVLVQMVPRHTTRAEMKKLFENAGLEITNIQMRMSRFTFTGDRYASVELANEEQAQQAVQKLNEDASLGEAVYVKLIRPDYEWAQPTKFEDDLGSNAWNTEAGVAKAVQPIIEGRRVQFKVKAPGWADLKTNVKTRNVENREIVKRNLSKFGLESVSPAATMWGDLKMRPRFICMVDFKTKQGAEEAIRTLHDTLIQDRLVWLEPSVLAPWRAYQLGRIDSAKLVELQEKGLAPTEIDETKFALPNSKP